MQFLDGKNNCPEDIAAKTAQCVADFLKISTYRKAEYVKSDMYSIENYNEAQNVLEYRFYADEEDDYTFTMYTTTTNNIFKPSGWGYVPVELFYGISVDDGYMQHVNSLPDGKYISYAADGDNRWRDGIMNNIHVNTIRNQT